MFGTSVMEFNILLRILASLIVLVLTCSAALPPEQYWKSALPNTEMPRAIKDILQEPDFIEEKSTWVIADEGKLGGQTGTYDLRSETVYDPKGAIFFLEKDLKPGTTMTFCFTKGPGLAGFLPREVAKSIPFSSKNWPETLDRFSVKPGSVEAKIMKNTIKECENPGTKEDGRYCATSLESMIDYIRSKLGNGIKAVSMEVNRETQMQKFTIEAGVERVYEAEASSVVCHWQNYAYAVFICHDYLFKRIYKVPMRGADGMVVRVITVCHTNTSTWNPKHYAFQVLKVKPGTVPICHFLLENDIVWFRK